MFNVTFSFDNQRLGNDLFPKETIKKELDPGSNIAKFANIVSNSARENILSQGERLSTPYPRLNEEYEVFKIKHYPDQPYILIAEENLFNAVTLIENYNYNNGSVVVGDETLLTITFNDEKLAYHDSEEEPRPVIPYRPVIGLTEEDADKVEAIFIEGLDRAGL